MTPSERTYTLRRFQWLVVLPTGSCFAVWGVMVLGREKAVVAHAVAGVLPLLGLLLTALYRHVSRDEVRWWPYVPSAVGALVFLISMEDLAHAIAREPGGAFIPVLPYGLALILPFVTLVGSLTSFVAPKGFLDG